jgi:hypothetical protein
LQHMIWHPKPNQQNQRRYRSSMIFFAVRTYMTYTAAATVG